MTTTLKSVYLLIIILLTSFTTINCQSSCIVEPEIQDNKKAHEHKKPQDSFYTRNLHTEKIPLPYNHIHEKDVFWEKKIWRVIDTREKLNHPFINAQAPLISILLDAANSGEITVYSSWNDKFSVPLSKEEIKILTSSTDTIPVIDPITFIETNTVVTNNMNPEDITKYRIKEVWFFNSETSTLGVRILGIAPIVKRYDDNGIVLNEGPLFWAYYPGLRKMLARTEVFNTMNDAGSLSWDDLFEARLFSSYIIKENNVHDRRIKDYASNSMNALLESERIKSEIRNFEHDLWSY